MDTRIAVAAKLLDAEHPGWAGKIDTAKLDMKEGNKCILGQLYGGWMESPSNLKYDNGSDNYRWAFHLYASRKDWIEAINMRTEVKHLSSELLAIKTFDEFVAWRDKVTHRDITVTIKASDARDYVEAFNGVRPRSVAQPIVDAIKTALDTPPAT